MNDTPLYQSNEIIAVETAGHDFKEITTQLADWLHQSKAKDGLLTVFIRHTSASLTIQENADPDVLHDLAVRLDKLAPRDEPYRHCNEGPDDMPAHIKSMLTQTQLSVPVQNGQMVLGTWQGIFVMEHRARPHTRHIALHYMGVRQG